MLPFSRTSGFMAKTIQATVEVTKKSLLLHLHPHLHLHLHPHLHLHLHPHMQLNLYLHQQVDPVSMEMDGAAPSLPNPSYLPSPTILPSPSLPLDLECLQESSIVSISGTIGPLSAKLSFLDQADISGPLDKGLILL